MQAGTLVGLVVVGAAAVGLALWLTGRRGAKPAAAPQGTADSRVGATGTAAPVSGAPEQANPELADAIVGLAGVEGNVCIVISRSGAKLDALQAALQARWLAAGRIARATEHDYESKPGIAAATVRCILLITGDQGPAYCLPLRQYEGQVLFETLDSSGWPEGVSRELIARFADWKNCYVDADGNVVRAIAAEPALRLVADAEAAREEAVASVVTAASEPGHLVVIVSNEAHQVESIRQRLGEEGIQGNRLAAADARTCHTCDHLESGDAVCVFLDPGKDGPTHVLPLGGKYTKVSVLDLGLARPAWVISRIQACVGGE